VKGLPDSVRYSLWQFEEQRFALWSQPAGQYNVLAQFRQSIRLAVGPVPGTEGASRKTSFANGAPLPLEQLAAAYPTGVGPISKGRGRTGGRLQSPRTSRFYGAGVGVTSSFRWSLFCRS
jgi:hypothetical protein